MVFENDPADTDTIHHNFSYKVSKQIFALSPTNEYPWQGDGSKPVLHIWGEV